MRDETKGDRQMGTTVNDLRAAIDIGTTKVCVVISARKPDQRLQVLGLGAASCDGLRKGVVTDAQAIAQSVRLALHTASEQAGHKINKAYVGLAGSHIASEARWTHVPRQPGVHPVNDADLEAALVTAARFDPAAGREVLHVIPRSYTLDGVHGVRNPAGMHTGELHIQSQAITGSSEHIQALQAAVLAAGITPAGMIVEPMATAESVLTAEDRDGVTVLVDIGGGKTDIAVLQDGVMVYATVLPAGGYQFTNDLSIALSLPYAEAEKLKVEKGSVTPDMMGQSPELAVLPAGMDTPLTITQRELGHLLRDRAEEMLEMVRLKLEVQALADTHVDRYVLTGGGAKLEGLLPLAKHLFQKKVRLGVPKPIDGLHESSRDPANAAAIGAVVWGMRNLPEDSHVARPHAVATSEGNILSSLFDWIPIWPRRGSATRPAAKVQ